MFLQGFRDNGEPGIVPGRLVLLERTGNKELQEKAKRGEGGVIEAREGVQGRGCPRGEESGHVKDHGVKKPEWEFKTASLLSSHCLHSSSLVNLVLESFQICQCFMVLDSPAGLRCGFLR